jgi:hypothetical protein
VGHPGGRTASAPDAAAGQPLQAEDRFFDLRALLFQFGEDFSDIHTFVLLAVCGPISTGLIPHFDFPSDLMEYQGLNSEFSRMGSDITVLSRIA